MTGSFFGTMRVRDVRYELEQERLRFADANQIAKLDVLRKAEELIGTERWDPVDEESTVWDREAVYAMRVDKLLEGVEY